MKVTRLYTHDEFEKMAGVFSKTAEKRYGQGVKDGKKANEEYIQILKKEIDDLLAKNILQQNEINKLKKKKA